LIVSTPSAHVTGSGEPPKTAYDTMGRYATVIDPINAPRIPPEPGIPPRFDAPSPIVVTLPAGHRWVADSDFEGKLAVIGRARQRFGAAVGSFDANGDGRADLYLAAGGPRPQGGSRRPPDQQG